MWVHDFHASKVEVTQDTSDSFRFQGSRVTSLSIYTGEPDMGCKLSSTTDCENETLRRGADRIGLVDLDPRPIDDRGSTLITLGNSEQTLTSAVHFFLKSILNVSRNSMLD